MRNPNERITKEILFIPINQGETTRNRERTAKLGTIKENLKEASEANFIVES